jgi:hypothetical protein
MLAFVEIVPEEIRRTSVDPLHVNSQLRRDRRLAPMPKDATKRNAVAMAERQLQRQRRGACPRKAVVSTQDERCPGRAPPHFNSPRIYVTPQALAQQIANESFCSQSSEEPLASTLLELETLEHRAFSRGEPASNVVRFHATVPLEPPVNEDRNFGRGVPKCIFVRA